MKKVQPTRGTRYPHCPSRCQEALACGGYWARWARCPGIPAHSDNGADALRMVIQNEGTRVVSWSPSLLVTACLSRGER